MNKNRTCTNAFTLKLKENKDKKNWYKQTPSVNGNKFETRIYDILKECNIEYIPQYEIENKFYDAYIPSLGILLEFDGGFFHKKRLVECKYGIQKKNYFNDLLKNKIAKKHNLKLIRIPEKMIIGSFDDILNIGIEI